MIILPAKPFRNRFCDASLAASIGSGKYGAHCEVATHTTETRSSAPAVPGTIPTTGEAFSDENFAKRATVALHSAKLAPIAVLVGAATIDELKRPGIHQFQKAVFSALAQGEFGLAFVLIGFRRIDVFQPDLKPAIVDRVAVDDALHAVPATAQRELAVSKGRDPAQYRDNVETEPLLDADTRQDPEENH